MTTNGMTEQPVTRDELEPLAEKLGEHDERLDRHSGKIRGLRLSVRQLKEIAEAANARGLRIEARIKTPLAVVKWVMPIASAVTTAGIIAACAMLWSIFKKLAVRWPG